MRINFRQGIISHDPAFLEISGNNVTLVANDIPLVVTIADGDDNYTHSESETVSNAWIVDATIKSWLYLEFDPVSFTRSFKSTIFEPIYQATPPAGINGLIWFNTSTNEMNQFVSGSWSKKIIVFVAAIENQTFYSQSIDSPAFTGTQAGLVGSAYTGYVVSDGNQPLLKSNKKFVTTEDDLILKNNDTSIVRLESNLFRAPIFDTSIATYSIVALRSDGTLTPAQYADVGETVVGVTIEDGSRDDIVSYVPQGSITNPSWSFPIIGVPLWVENGMLVDKDPHLQDVSENPIKKTPVARVIARDTILFEQGLGGVGPKGDVGLSGGQQLATDSVPGAVLLSTNSGGVPIAVADDDPRLTLNSGSSQHTHAASEVTTTPFGSISATDVQGALSDLEIATVKKAGDTMSGKLTLDGDPVDDLHAATKLYVDSSISAIDTTHTHAASEITFIPSGSVTSSNVQLAISQLDSNKFAKSGGSINGNTSITGTLDVSDTATFNILSASSVSTATFNAGNVLLSGRLASTSNAAFGGNVHSNTATVNTVDVNNPESVVSYGVLTQYAAEKSHTHPVSDIVGLDLSLYLTQTTADTLYSGIGHTHALEDISGSENIPTMATLNTTFAPISHTHTISEITDLDVSNFATSQQGAKADTALQDLSTSNFTDLNDVSVGSATTGNTVKFNGINWESSRLFSELPLVFQGPLPENTTVAKVPVTQNYRLIGGRFYTDEPSTVDPATINIAINGTVAHALTIATNATTGQFTVAGAPLMNDQSILTIETLTMGDLGDISLSLSLEKL